MNLAAVLLFSTNLMLYFFPQLRKYLYSIFLKRMSSNSNINQSCPLKRNGAFCAPSQGKKYGGPMISMDTSISFRRKVQMISNGEEGKVNTSDFV